jgi:hypothetical protein
VGERIIKICDDCGNDLEDGTGAVLKLTYINESRGARKADLCDQCAAKIPGRPARTRRSRRQSRTGTTSQ